MPNRIGIVKRLFLTIRSGKPYLHGRMKKLLFLLPFLASCGLFKKPIPKVELPKTAFETVNYPEIRKALALDYVLAENGEEMDFTLYPLTDSGYDCDYQFAGNRGFVSTSMSARANAVRYFNDFGGTLAKEESECAGWLSQRNFYELLSAGKTVMGTGRGDTAITYQVTGTSDYTVVLQDTSFTIKVVELLGVEKPYYISFLPDPAYPLMVKMNLRFQQTLVSVQNAESNYSYFEPGKGCVLQYRMVEAGVNEYEIKLHNMIWTDTLLRFDMSGTFTSESYSYNFEYDVVYRGKALSSPDFMTPVFSVIKGEKVEDETNWIFLRRDEINAAEKNRKGFLSIPHYADDPRELPDAYEDTASFNAALREFENSYHTEFEHDRLGRIKHADYMYFDNDWQDNLIMGVSRFLAPEYDMELMVLNRGPFPLLVYYDDGQMYEIFLESAGRAEEE